MDLRQIKASADDFGLMTYDPAFMNTASCQSAHHVHRRRQRHPALSRLPDRAARRAAAPSSKSAYLLLHGELPDATRAASSGRTTSRITRCVHENIKKFMDGFHYDAHPMGMLVSTVGALSTFYPDAKDIFDDAVARACRSDRLIAQDADDRGVRLPAHASGLPYVYPDNDLSYTGNFLNMLFKTTELKYEPQPGARARARRAVHPARRSRAELQHQRDARRRQLAGRSVLGDRRQRRRRSTARCTAARTKRCCGCSTEIGSIENVPGVHQAGQGAARAG